MDSDDPYAVLGVPPTADDAALRAAYLAKVQEYPPERCPKEFAAVRRAYELVKDFDSRVRYRLFPPTEHDPLGSILEDLSCRTPRPRPSLEKLFKTAFETH
jgi:DnaJ-class molecular chaperone